MSKKIIYTAGLFLLVVYSCKKDPVITTVDSRSFYMGFTPFPYAISVEAVNWSYTHIATDADLICQSFDDGIPWDQALADAPFSAHIMDDWNYRKASTPAGHKIFIQQAATDFYRTHLAPIRDTTENQPLTAPWDTLRFNDEKVKTAYLNYCKRLIDFFQPDYFNCGLEANMVLANNPGAWNDYLELHAFIYTQLKMVYPALQIFISFQGSYLLEGEITGVDYAAQAAAVNDLMPYIDLFGISIYPYATNLSTDSIPTDIFDQLAVLAQNKPMAVTETGYISSTLELTDPPVTIVSDPDKQNNYIIYLLDEAEQHHFVFVNNYVIRDYDILWQQLGGIADITALWRNTGLYDSAGLEKPALATWKSYLEKPLE